eukprot:GHVQ01042428.1.p1 GENE.GHVQ01042428.1~~GHVQ01042428.1.p1  ORF type:complete len:124 (+),score=17.48 GHVQ01042428.1:245-616(+)
MRIRGYFGGSVSPAVAAATVGGASVGGGRCGPVPIIMGHTHTHSPFLFCICYRTHTHAHTPLLLCICYRPKYYLCVVQFASSSAMGLLIGGFNNLRQLVVQVCILILSATSMCHYQLSTTTTR